MRKKIFLYYMILTIVSLCITGFFISELAQKFYKYEVEDKLISTAILMQHHISSEIAEGDKVDYNNYAIEYAKVLNQPQANFSPLRTGTRITIMDFNGKVLGESDKNYTEMEDHSTRKEVIEALNGKVGKDTRFSTTMRYDYLYIAVPVQNAGVIIRVSVPLIQLKLIYRIIWFYAVAGVISGVVLTTFLALRFSKTVTTPVNELIKVSKEISMGNYSKRAVISSNDEMGQLADTFNAMAAQLEKNMVDLTDKNVKVDSIINSMISGIVAVDRNYKIILVNEMAFELFGIKNRTSIVGANIIEFIRNNQINQLLRDCIDKNISLVNEISIGSPDEKILRIYTNPIKSEASATTNLGGIIFIQDVTNIRKLEQIRTEFVSNVTHELKTPLTSIRGFIETLRSGALNDRNVAERFLEIIDIEAERLYMLINDILQLSEIESKQKDTNISTHNLKSIVDHTISVLHGVAEKKQITISSEVDENIKIVANKDRIKQMLINLIENGIKYNVENGSVHIKAYKEEGKIVITIKDTGIGISQEHVPRIFERFYRVDKGRSRNMGGTGLGLSIVKHIVNLYNGDIKVISQPGDGTEFIVRLPA